MRRSVRSPDCRRDDLAQDLVGVQAALHQHLDLAVARQRRRGRGRRVAVLAWRRSGIPRCPRRSPPPPRGCAPAARPAPARSARAAPPRARRAANRDRRDGPPRSARARAARSARSRRANTSLRRRMISGVAMSEYASRRRGASTTTVPHSDATLADARIAVEHDEARVRLLLAHRHRGRELLADADRARVIELLRHDARARPRQPALQQPGDHRARPRRRRPPAARSRSRRPPRGGTARCRPRRAPAPRSRSGSAARCALAVAPISISSKVTLR